MGTIKKDQLRNIKIVKKKAMKPPKKYAVALLNDDFTPMDFVIEILMDIFFMDEMKAQQIMWKVHREGSAICGIFSLDIAQTKQKQVQVLAYEAKYPLQCKIKEAE